MLPLGDFFTIRELADFLRVNRRTVERLLFHHRLPAVRVGRAVRVPKADVDRWLRQQIEAGAGPWKRTMPPDAGESK